MIISGCIQLGSVPDVDIMVDMTPVDYVSRALVHLSRQKESLGKTFHLVNPHLIHLSDLVTWFRAFGYPLQQIALSRWQAELLNRAWHSQDNTLNSIMALSTR